VTSGVRSGELFAALSLATDLGTGQQAEHGLRTCLLAMELAELTGLEAEAVEDAFYLGLLHSIGCTADAPVTARAFGDDRAHKAAYTLIDPGRSIEIVTYLWRNVYPTAPRPQRLQAFVAAMAAGPQFARVNMRSHCEVGERLAERLRLPARVQEGLWFVFERWDGKGMPAGVAGERIPIAARILHAARDASAFAVAGGVEMVVAMAERCGGSSLDPSLGALLCDHADELLERVGGVDAWERAVQVEPRPRVFIGDELAEACQVIADYADLKSLRDARALARGGGTRRGSRLAARVRRGGDRGASLRRVAARPRPGGRVERGVGEARPVDERRMGAGAAAQLPQRAAARADSGARRACAHGRVRSRAARRVRLSPRPVRSAAAARCARARGR
jgi:hypothetical protein